MTPAELLRVVRDQLRPHLVIAARIGDQPEDGVPLLDGRYPVGGRAAAYVCEHLVCNAPVSTPQELAKAR